MGILEQPDLDSDLTRRRLSRSRREPSQGSGEVWPPGRRELLSARGDYIADQREWIVDRREQLADERELQEDEREGTPAERGHQPSRMRCKKRLVRQAGGELIDIERLVEAGVQSLGIDQQADLGGLASEQPTETWV